MNLINLKNISTLLLAASRKIIYSSLVVLILSFPSYALQIVDSEIQDVLKKLVGPILEASGTNPEEVTIYVIADKSINAFVANGRNIFISTELIARFNDPDILKGVVAHELGHIAGGHLVRRDEKIREIQNQSMLATGLLGALSAISGNPTAIMGSLMGPSHVFYKEFLSYSRTQEASADQAAVRFLHDSNNSVKGLMKLLNYFDIMERRGYKEPNPYSRTHPLSRSRISSVKYALSRESRGGGSTASEREQYSRIVAKLRGFLKNVEIPKEGENTSSDLDRFSQKYRDVVYLYSIHQTDEALSVLENLIKIEPHNGYLHEMKAQILFRSGDFKKSLESYRIAVSYIDNPILKAEYAVSSAHYVESVEDEYEKRNILEEVVTLLESVILQNIKNPYIYRVLGTAYGKLGDLGYANLMLAEEAFMSGKIADAEQFIISAKRNSRKRTRLNLRIDDIMKQIKNLKS